MNQSGCALAALITHHWIVALLDWDQTIWRERNGISVEAVGDQGAIWLVASGELGVADEPIGSFGAIVCQDGGEAQSHGCGGECEGGEVHAGVLSGQKGYEG